ncbi:MAG: NUDIX hydrolase [Anaerolineae bacterium]|nr:MAG: NUDIX hydrolase [Anaerolineae bacterium]
MSEGRASFDTPGTYDASRFERPSVAVDLAIFTLRREQLQVLLIERKRWPFEGMWALPGGFVHIDESLEEAARRELEEETGVRDVYLEQLYTFGDVDRDPRTRVITVAYFALISSDHLQLRAASDAADVGWFPAGDPPPLAFDHDDILSYAVTRLRYKLEYSAVGFQLLPAEFTLTELQTAYETILEEKLDKRNFRRRVLQAGVLEETGFYRLGEHRPAKLYRFRDDAVAEIKARRLFP